MFEIWGTLNGKNKEKDKRLASYLTRTLTFEEQKSLLFFSPFDKAFEQRLVTEETAVMTFKHTFFSNSPYVNMKNLKTALNIFLPYKDKIIVSLSAECRDYNLVTEKMIPITLNIANFKASIHSSKIFFDEESGASYFTYMKNSPHLVWLEDTKSIALKHNLIKSSGYKGIYWENPYPLLDGNWEALTAIYKKA